MIDSPEQRQRYKNDFNAEYSEYRGLHARIEGITRQFTVLDNELKQLQQGTDKYKVFTKLRSTFIYSRFIPQEMMFIISDICLCFADNSQSDTSRVS